MHNHPKLFCTQVYFFIDEFQLVNIKSKRMGGKVLAHMSVFVGKKKGTIIIVPFD